MRLLFTLLLCLIISVSALKAQTVVTVNSNITTNTTWTSNNIYLLSGPSFIYVTNNATLTIEAGTIIKADPSALIITRGAKIMAEGTKTRPIVFTSNKPAGQRNAGDWGGLGILGRAPINVPGGESTLEGGLDPDLGKYGGGANPDPNDNSGVLRYVRIEFAGIAFQPNNEINSLTMGGVGLGTTIEHVQTSYGGDDAFEWFGGNVNGKFLIAYKTVDDMFDTDFGYQGKNQFVLGISDPNIADISGSNGFESDNDGTGTTNTPLTDPKFVNLSIFGPLETPNTTINSNYRRGAHIRRSSQLDIYNSSIVGFPTALRLESSNSVNAFLNGDLNLKNNIWSGSIDSTTTTYQQVLTQLASSNNTIVTGPADLQVTNPYSSTNPDFRPATGSPLLSNADAGIYGDAFYTSVTFRGAFGTNSDWDKCWAEFDPQNADYSTAPLDYVAAFTSFSSSVNNNVATYTAPAGSGLSYLWDFGDFTTSTMANPSHTYQALGTYNVSLLLTTARGCTKTLTGTVTITTGTPEIAINNDITTNTTWTSNNVYRLTGSTCIYVRNNATLTIQPGTIIKGDPSALVVTRGAKIIADGTREMPIVFTSARPAGQRAAGDWGGLIILGNAPINTPGGQSVVEGGCDPTLATYGGTNAADNSGILRYVRVEFAGIAFQPNNELNSFTFGGVGSGTVIEHVQSSFGGDDALEWFGGTVNGKWMIAYKTVDDMFDTDFGYQGKNQFVLGISDPNIADISGSNGFESDNDGTGTTNTPLTDPKFVNLSIFGPKQTPNTAINSNYRRGAHIRRSSSHDIYNSAIVGFPTALRLESSNSVNGFLAGTLNLKNNIWSGTIDSTTTTYQQVLTQLTANNNTVVSGPADLMVANPYSSTNPDFRPQTGSPLLSGADAGIYADAFYTAVTYRGAFGANSDWDKCWTEWDPQNADYSVGPLNYVAGLNTINSQVSNNIVIFTAPTGNNLSYFWDFGDFNTSTQANPVHVYQALGTYNVTLIITTPRGCSKTLTGTVTISSGTPEIAINGDITSNTTWTNNNIYRLTGATCIYVRNNATLTIQPGTIIKGDPSALVITRGSKIIADGTAEQPIVFTSAQPAGQRAAGDWGGLIILGNAPINTPGGSSVVEGGCDPTLATYGGTNAADNSGILRYVRVEFAGIAFQPNNELNSFTFGGVGSGTVIEHVQSSFGGDDALEWFGGTVNGKWVIAYKTVDDMFDTDFGYQGKNQFVLGISDPNIADISGSNGFESDNDGTGTTNTPLTDPKFVNLSIFGPLQTPNTAINSNYRRGAHIRRSSSHDIYNSAIVGFPTALRLESSNSINAFLNGDLDLSANIWSGTIDSTSTNYQAVLTQLAASNNTLVTGPADLLVGDPYTIDNPDFRPQAGSPLLSGVDADIYADNFFTTVDYRGAFGADSNWEKCWTEWDPNTAEYNVAPLNYFSNRPDAFNFSQNGGTVIFAAPAGDFDYAWDFGLPGDDDNSSVANPTFVYPAAGQYTVTLTVTNARGCETEITETLDIVTGVKEIEGLSFIRVFPNPTSGDATLDIFLSEDLYAEVAMFDITGRLVFRHDQQFELGQNQLTLPTDNLANGIYLIRLMAENGVKTLKLRVSK